MAELQKGNSVQFRVDKTSNYTVMSNQHFHVTNMSLQAKGLLSLILSLPNDWDYSINGLVSICMESRYSVKKILTELQNLGYLKINKKYPNQTDSGRIEYEYIIYENSNTPEKLEFKWQNKG